MGKWIRIMDQNHGSESWIRIMDQNHASSLINKQEQSALNCYRIHLIEQEVQGIRRGSIFCLFVDKWTMNIVAQLLSTLHIQSFFSFFISESLIPFDHTNHLDQAFKEEETSLACIWTCIIALNATTKTTEKWY